VSSGEISCASEDTLSMVDGGHILDEEIPFVNFPEAQRRRGKEEFRSGRDCYHIMGMVHHIFLKQLSCQKRPRYLTPPRYTGLKHLKQVPLERRHSDGRMFAYLYLMSL
jgi:hypothetical protein